MSLVSPQSTLSFLGFVVLSLPDRPTFPHTKSRRGLIAESFCWIAVMVWGGVCSAFSLNENQIGDVGAEALARAVHVNTSLKTLV